MAISGNIRKMLIPPKYILTPKISELLSTIESCKEVINSVDIPAEIEINIRRKSTLKSSLFSARIEGNNLSLEDLPRISSKDQRKVEVNNILVALNKAFQRSAKDLTLKDILELHSVVMKDLTDFLDLGKLRTENNAIFNSAGIAIYLPPRPNQVTPLLIRLVNFINSSKEQFVPIRACLAHYTFEKIHPFLDGNGRVGRVILQMVMQKSGYGMKGLLAVEEQLDKNRALYYRALEQSERDVTDYLEFMLEMVAEAARDAKNQVLEKKQTGVEDFLLPRRAEILAIIKDHGLVSFDQIRRRFLGINERTLRYDLKKLQDSGLIKKRGQTKGVFYELSQN